MTVTVTTVDRGAAPGDGTGDNAYVGTGKINDNFSAFKTAVEALEGRFWTLDNTARSLAMGERVKSSVHAGITHTLPSTFTQASDALSDIWVWNPDTNSNITLAPTVGDQIYLNGTGQGVGNSLTIEPGVVAIISVRTTDSEWDVILLNTPAAAEVNDLSVAVTWANVPDANITQSSVTQHVGAIDHDSLLNYVANQHVAITNGVETLTSGEVTQLGNIGATVISAADWTAVSNLSGTNSGDQTSMSGISDTKANFDTACNDGDFMYIGDAPTAHTHLLAAGATDVTATAAEVNVLDLSATALTTGWVYAADGVSTASWRQLLGSEISNDSGWTSNTGDMLLGTAQTVTANKIFNNGTLLLDDSDSAFNLVLASTSTITTANKTLTFDVNDANRTLTLGGNATLNGGTHSGTNTGDSQTLAAGVSDVTATAAEVNLLDLAGLTAGWVLGADTATTASWRQLLGSEINNDQGWTSNAGTVTSVTGGTGVSSTGGATPAIALTVDELAEKTGAVVGTDRLVGTTGTTNWAETISGIPLSIFNNDSGWTSNAGTVTAVTCTGATSGLASSGGATPDITLDFGNLPDGTGAIVGSVDQIIYLDAGVEKRKQVNEWTLSDFNNDLGWTTNTGTVTSVSAGTGMSFTTITGTGSVSIDTTMDAITTMYNTALQVGYDSANYIDFDLTDFAFFFDSIEDFRFSDGGSALFNGDVTAYSTTISSDRNLKENIQVIPDALGKVQQLNGVTFNWIRDGKEAAGLIAQDVQSVLPEAVKTVKDALNGDDEYLALNYDSVTGLLVEAVKILIDKVEALEKRAN